MPEPRRRKTIRLGTVLVVLFVVALVMGPGPGLYLINPNPSDPTALRTFLGMPIVYAWGLLWFIVLVGIIIIAYFKVWVKDEPEP